MDTVKIGSLVVFKQEKTHVKVIKEIEGQMFAVLELVDKQNVSVPCSEIKRNGSILFVMPNGCNVADAIRLLEESS